MPYSFIKSINTSPNCVFQVVIFQYLDLFIDVIAARKMKANRRRIKVACVPLSLMPIEKAWIRLYSLLISWYLNKNVYLQAICDDWWRSILISWSYHPDSKTCYTHYQPRQALGYLWSKLFINVKRWMWFSTSVCKSWWIYIYIYIYIYI